MCDFVNKYTQNTIYSNILGGHCGHGSKKGLTHNKISITLICSYLFIPKRVTKGVCRGVARQGTATLISVAGNVIIALPVGGSLLFLTSAGLRGMHQFTDILLNQQFYNNLPSPFPYLNNNTNLTACMTPLFLLLVFDA